MNINEFISYNTEKSGALSRETYFSKHYTTVYLEVLSYTSGMDITFKEKLYRYFNNDTDSHLCICNKKTKLISISKGFQEFCSVKCSNVNTVDRIHSVKLEKYGNANYNNVNKFKESIKHTMSNRKDEIVNKRMSTKQNKYGDSLYTNRKKSLETRNKTTIENIQQKVNTQVSTFQVLSVLPGNAYTIHCDDCNETSTITNCRLNKRIRDEKVLCPVCNNYNTGVSSSEHEIIEYITSLGITNIKHSKKWFDGIYETDIYLPDYNIGIEFNGLYWHSELNKPDVYHINKQNKFENEGVHIIHIWEDEWLYKSDIVKSRLCNLLKNNNARIYGRKCKIVELPYKVENEFVTKHHIQGPCMSKYRIGLEYNNELIAVMTFGTRKISRKLNIEGEYELLRFCTKFDTTVIGGANKLLKYFIKTYKPNKILTYANRSWSQKCSNIYTTMGFIFNGMTPPNFFYFDRIEKIRMHRYNFRKSVIGKNDSRTAREIMISKNMYRIYDCGSYRYEMNF